MKSSEVSKERDVLRQIANASDAIRRKHKMLNLGKMTTESAMSEVFKPMVTPLEKLVDQSAKQDAVIKKEEKIYKNEESGYNDQFDRTFATAHDDSLDEFDQTIRDDDDNDYNNDESKADNLSLPYLQMFDTQKKNLDLSYGVRKLQGNRLMIGDSSISFNNNMMHIGDKDYEQTTGLLELLFKKEPDETLVSANDMENYRRILKSTNAYRKYYGSEHPIRDDKSAKFTNIIATLANSPVKRTPKRQSQRSGKGLPRHMVARKRSQMDYVYWDDPNELVDRLRLLLASQAAGNSSHSNEIISIIEELREATIIY